MKITFSANWGKLPTSSWREERSGDPRRIMPVSDRGREKGDWTFSGQIRSRVYLDPDFETNKQRRRRRRSELENKPRSLCICRLSQCWQGSSPVVLQPDRLHCLIKTSWRYLGMRRDSITIFFWCSWCLFIYLCINFKMWIVRCILYHLNCMYMKNHKILISFE
jgi:hypothetical protein